MTKAEIIAKAQLSLDDSSELSSAEFSDLFEKIYQVVCMDRLWEFTKKEHTGTQSTSVPYISLPSDFLALTTNSNYTDSSYAADRPVIFVGSQYAPYQVVSWSDRRQYRDQKNVAWIDIVNSRLYFGTQPTSADAVEFDYYATMPDLTDNESPVFPAQFHDVIYHGMVADEFIIEQSDKAQSYAPENSKIFERYIGRMAMWNARLVQQ